MDNRIEKILANTEKVKALAYVVEEKFFGLHFTKEQFEEADEAMALMAVLIDQVELLRKEVEGLRD